NKKGAPRPSLGYKEGLGAPSPSNRSRLLLWRHTLTRYAMSIHLAGGLALVAGQSCVAGPAVFSTSNCHESLSPPQAECRRVSHRARFDRICYNFGAAKMWARRHTHAMLIRGYCYEHT